jgi:CheY-like chemotaxis protein
MGMLVARRGREVGNKHDIILWKSAAEVKKRNSHNLSFHDMPSATVLKVGQGRVITEVHGHQCSADFRLVRSFSASYLRQIKVFGGFVKLPSVLVVDDDEAVATVLQDILLIAGYQVSVTSSSSVALAAITKGTFGVLIYDLSVNGKQGCFPFLASCLKYRPGLVILLITGFADEGTRRQAANLKIHLLEKPFLATDLLAQVSALVSEADLSLGRAQRNTA